MNKAIHLFLSYCFNHYFRGFVYDKNKHNMSKIKKQEALDYHSQGRPGKIEVIPSKPYSSQRDLSLAYSPGVAEPCLRIAEIPGDVYKDTAKGNLVAVISIGPAVLELAELGPEAA